MKFATYLVLFFTAATAWAYTTTTNMSLKTPASGDTDYPTSISDSFTLIDAHDHTSGKGVQVPTGGIADSAVTTAKLGALSVTGAKIAAATVTNDKRAALGQQVSSSSGGFSTSSSSAADVTNLSVTITTTGRPVFIGLVDDASGGISYLGANFGTASALEAAVAFLIVEGSTTIAKSELSNAADGDNFGVSSKIPPSSLWTIRAPAAGTYTYKVQAMRLTGSGTTAAVVNSKLIAYEL
jgi:hypothetical protein